MTRRKVKFTYISNEATRKATYKKRKKGLVKKVSELSTLCGVEACAVIYSPFETQPEVFPPSHEGVNKVLSRFSRMPEMDQNMKMVNQEGFLRQRIVKAADQLTKLRKENREKDVTRIMFQCMTPARPKILQGLTLVDLKDLDWVVDQKLKEVRKRLGEVAGPAQREVVGTAERQVVGAAEREVVVKEEEKEEEELEGEGEGELMPPPPPPGSRDFGKKVVVRGGSGGAGGGSGSGGGGSSDGGGGAVQAGMEGGGGSDGEKQQSFIDLMMNHQGHHENKIMNLGFENAWESSTYWGDRVFP